MDLLARVFRPLLEHRRELLYMNLLYIGAILFGVVLTALDPMLQRTLLEAVGQSFSTGLAPVVEAYSQGQLAQAIVLTFVVNLFAGSLLVITAPSLVLPFWGLFMGVYRGVMWGIIFSPLGGFFDQRFLPHLLTGLIEGEAYVVAMLGVWLWWWPVVSDWGERWRHWKEGLRLQVPIYGVVILLLAIAAIYEAIEVIYLLPRS